MKREKVNVTWNVFVTKFKISNLFDIIIKIVKCCATYCQGNYTKDKQGKAFRQYQTIWKKERNSIWNFLGLIKETSGNSKIKKNLCEAGVLHFGLGNSGV